MNLKLLLLVPVCLAVAGCDQQDKHPTQPNQKNTIYNADDTGINVRDREKNLPVAGDQPETESDRTITQKVRQVIVRDGDLSTNAKNIKIITIRGVVTLRGPVNNENEKANLERKARSIDGVDEVVNRLDIVHG